MIAFIDKIIGRVTEKNGNRWTSRAHANPHQIHDEGSSFSSKRIKGKTIERIAKDMSETRLSKCTTSLAAYRPIRQKTWRTNTRNNFVNACLLFSPRLDLMSPFSRLLSCPSPLPCLFVKRAKCHFPARSEPGIVLRPLYVRQQG